MFQIRISINNCQLTHLEPLDYEHSDFSDFRGFAMADARKGFRFNRRSQVLDNDEIGEILMDSDSGNEMENESDDDESACLAQEVWMGLQVSSCLI